MRPLDVAPDMVEGAGVRWPACNARMWHTAGQRREAQRTILSLRHAEANLAWLAWLTRSSEPKSCLMAKLSGRPGRSAAMMPEGIHAVGAVRGRQRQVLSARVSPAILSGT